MDRRALVVDLATYFFYGTLCHRPLLERVLGRPVVSTRAHLEDHAVNWAAGESFPLIVAQVGAQAEGLLVEDLSDRDVARLDFYEGGFAYHTHEVSVGAPGGRSVAAQVYFPDPGHWLAGAPWDLGDWVARWGDIVLETAGDFMALFGHKTAEAVLARYPMMLVRGASRVRAREAAPTRLRRHAGPDDVAVAHRAEPYGGYFAVEDYDLSFRRFDGAMSARVPRAVFIGGDAATVLPYDPLRDRVLLIEQFRPGPFARGDAQPWLLEPIAGRVDPGETPEAAARREALEEAGLVLDRLVAVGAYYPSPAAKSEYLYSFVALTDLPDATAGVAGGVAGEHEDIRTHLVSFDDLLALITSGEGANGPLQLTAWWLAAHRDQLRREAQAG